jgi:hypothetical protein
VYVQGRFHFRQEVDQLTRHFRSEFGDLLWQVSVHFINNMKIACFCKKVEDERRPPLEVSVQAATRPPHKRGLCKYPHPATSSSGARHLCRSSTVFLATDGPPPRGLCTKSMSRIGNRCLGNDFSTLVLRFVHAFQAGYVALFPVKLSAFRYPFRIWT